MKIFIKYLGLFLLALVLGHFLAKYFGLIYHYIIPPIGGTFPAPQNSANYLVGVSLSYITILTLLFTAFGDQKKYWVMGVLLIPAVIFELYFDASHIYIPIILGIVGWAIGLGIDKIVSVSRTRPV